MPPFCAGMVWCLGNLGSGGNSVCEQKCHNNATPEGETQYLDLTDCYDYCFNAGYYYNDCL